jgi:hypothetical protein
VLAVSHLWELSDEQYAAMRALHRGEPAPPASAAVWPVLLSLGMVWIDKSGDPPVVRLTSIGRNYDAR